MSTNLRGQQMGMLKETPRVATPKLPAMQEIKRVERHVEASAAQYADRIDAVAKAAKRRTATANSGGGLLLLDDGLKLDTNLSSKFDKLVTPAMACFAAGKALVDVRQWPAALAKFEELHALAPAHAEGTYYRAYCQFMLDRDEPALETLMTLAAIGAPKRILRSASLLCAEIRPRLAERTGAENKRLLADGDSVGAVRHAERLVQLDPEAAFYHYLLTLDLLVGDRLAEARAASDEAGKLGDDDDKERLKPLQEEILRRLTLQALEPARQLFRGGQYRAALDSALRLDEQIRQASICRTFLAYVRERDAKRVDVPQSIPEADAESLFDFLATEELRMSELALAMGNFPLAINFLERALELVPPHGYSNFLYAHAQWTSIASALNAGTPPPIDEAIDRLKRAEPRAKRAARVQGIESGPALLKAIQEWLVLFDDLQQQIQKQMAEAKLVNQMILEFNGVMQLAEKGIDSEKTLDDLDRRFATLEGRIPGVQKHVQGEEGGSILKELRAACERNRAQIAEIKREIGARMREAAPVNELIADFGTAMDSINKLGSVAFSSAATRLRSVKERIPNVRRNVQSDEGKKALNDLLQAIDQVLSQLRGF